MLAFDDENPYFFLKGVALDGEEGCILYYFFLEMNMNKPKRVKKFIFLVDHDKKLTILMQMLGNNQVVKQLYKASKAPISVLNEY